MAEAAKGKQFRFDIRPETHRLLKACAGIRGESMGDLADELIRTGLAELARKHNIEAGQGKPRRTT